MVGKAVSAALIIIGLFVVGSTWSRASLGAGLGGWEWLIGIGGVVMLGIGVVYMIRHSRKAFHEGKRS